MAQQSINIEINDSVNRMQKAAAELTIRINDVTQTWRDNKGKAFHDQYLKDMAEMHKFTNVLQMLAGQISNLH